MELNLTRGAARAMEEASAWSLRPDCLEVETPAMLLGLLIEPECCAALRLQKCGVVRDSVIRRWPTLQPRQLEGDTPPDAEVTSTETAMRDRSDGLTDTASMAAYTLLVDERPMSTVQLSLDMQSSLSAMVHRLQDHPRPLELTTEHLLLALLTADHDVADWLVEQGLCLDPIQAELDRCYGVTAEMDEPVEMPLEVDLTNEDEHESGPEASPMPISAPVPSEVPHQQEPDLPVASLPGEQFRVLRIIDAAANRSREGLRVVEDYVRFVLDDHHLTEQLKGLRHDLASQLAQIPTEHRLAARETQSDVGTNIGTASERSRENIAHVLTANFTRVQESLRSLEEFGKILNPEMAVALEQIRYRAYTLHRVVENTRASLERLAAARLYVLIDSHGSERQFVELAQSLVDVGVHVLQLRDKSIDDRTLIARARQLRELTRSTSTLFVVNDRPDVAALSDADGVHVGQEELRVKDIRTMLGPEALVGVSTHTIEQARQAVMDGANYIGVGPTFASGTKRFDHFPGLDLLRHVATEIRLPAFAIGGIDSENLPQVLATGTGRIAVSGAVSRAADPVAAASELLVRLGG